jgi:hypothetical protein
MSKKRDQTARLRGTVEILFGVDDHSNSSLEYALLASTILPSVTALIIPRHRRDVHATSSIVRAGGRHATQRARRQARRRRREGERICVYARVCVCVCVRHVVDRVTQTSALARDTDEVIRCVSAAPPVSPLLMSLHVVVRLLLAH